MRLSLAWVSHSILTTERSQHHSRRVRRNRERRHSLLSCADMPVAFHAANGPWDYGKRKCPWHAASLLGSILAHPSTKVWAMRVTIYSIGVFANHSLDFSPFLLARKDDSLNLQSRPSFTFPSPVRSDSRE